MKRNIKFHIYKAKDGYRWRALSNNGKLTSESGEAYQSKFGCKKSLVSFLSHMKGGHYEIVDKE